jgi:hypothetical protein
MVKQSGNTFAEVLRDEVNAPWRKPAGCTSSTIEREP